MNRKPFQLCLSFLVAAIAGSRVEGATAWNEQVGGDLSGDRLNPTAIALQLGVNSITATSVFGDVDYYRITLPVGWQLDQIVVTSFLGEDFFEFIAVQSGSTFTEPAVNTDVTQLLGWAHFGPGADSVGTDILDDIAVGPDAIGFTSPLSAGTYTFWQQQAGLTPTTVQLDFIVSPSPSVLAMLALALIAPQRRRSA